MAISNKWKVISIDTFLFVSLINELNDASKSLISLTLKNCPPLLNDNDFKKSSSTLEIVLNSVSPPSSVPTAIVFTIKLFLLT